jgi:hypothetical protein
VGGIAVTVAVAVAGEGVKVDAFSAAVLMSTGFVSACF